MCGNKNNLSCSCTDLFDFHALADQYGWSRFMCLMNLNYFGCLIRWDWDYNCLDMILTVFCCDCVDRVDEVLSWSNVSYFCIFNLIYLWFFNCICQLNTLLALYCNYHTWRTTWFTRFIWLTWLAWYSWWKVVASLYKIKS